MKKIAKKTAKFALATTAVAATGVGATTAAAAVATTAVAAVVGKKVVKGIAKSALKSSRSSEKKSDNAVAVNEYQPVAHSVYYYPVASVVSQAYSNAYSAEPARQFVLDISQLKVPFHSITLTNETSVNLFCYEDNFCFLITPKDSKTSLYKCFYREEFGEVCNHFVMFDKKHILYWTKNSNTNCFVLNAETGNMYKIHEFFPGVKGKLKSMKLRGQWLGLVAERYFSAYGAKDFIAIINIKNLGLTKPIYCGEIEKDYHIRYFELTMDGTLCVVEDNNVLNYKATNGKLIPDKSKKLNNIDFANFINNYLITLHYDNEHHKYLGLEVRDINTLDLVEVIPPFNSNFNSSVRLNCKIHEAGTIELQHGDFMTTVVSNVLYKAYLTENFPLFIRFIDEALPNVRIEDEVMQGLPAEIKNVIKAYLINRREPNAVIPENDNNPSAEQKNRLPPAIIPAAVAPVPQIANNRCGFFGQVVGAAVGVAAVASALYFSNLP